MRTKVAEGSIVETIEYKRLTWYGHLERSGRAEKKKLSSTKEEKERGIRKR
jgi:hypothetical protein